MIRLFMLILEKRTIVGKMMASQAFCEAIAREVDGFRFGTVV